MARRRSARLSEASKSVQEATDEVSDLSELSVRPQSRDRAIQDRGAEASADIQEQDNELGSPEEGVVQDKSSDEDFEPGGKKAKEKSKKKKKKKAKKKRSSTKPDSPLLSLPPEMLLQVFSFTDFESLYNLSFVNKQFRAILTDASCDSIWLSAMEREEVPRATGILFIQQAHFCLSNRCQECSRTTEMMPDAFVRMVLCQSCRAHLTVSNDHVLSVFSAHEEQHPLTRRIVTADLPRGGRRLKLRVRNMNQYLLDNFPVPEGSDGRWNESLADWNWNGDRPQQASARLNGPLTRVGAFLEEHIQSAHDRDREAAKIERWIRNYRTNRPKARKQLGQARLDQLREMLLEAGWSADDFDHGWNTHAVPSIAFQPVHLDHSTFQTLLPRLNTWIARNRRRRQEEEARQRQWAEVQQQRARERQEQERIKERKEAALRNLFSLYSETAGVDALKIPFAAFTLLPSVQPILDNVEGVEYDVEAFKEQAILEALEAANTCETSILKDLKRAASVLADKVPHLDLHDLIDAGRIEIGEMSIDDFHRRLKPEAAAFAVLKAVDLNALVLNPAAEARPRMALGWTFGSLASLNNDVFTNTIFKSFETLQGFRNALNMRTATDWACDPNNKLLYVRPRHLLAYLIAVRALKHQGVPSDQWAAAINREDKGSWYCHSCGILKASPAFHIGRNHLYHAKGDDAPQASAPDDFDVWNVGRLPDLTYLKPPTNQF